MTLIEQLLQQADKLADEPLRANLRRAVSTAYYALFHFLIRKATRSLCPEAADLTRRQLMARAFDHGTMKSASLPFAGRGPFLKPVGALFPQLQVPPALREVAKIFIELQEARHWADYDLSRRMSRVDARQHIAAAHRAIETLWPECEGTEAANVYLLTLLLHGPLSKRP